MGLAGVIAVVAGHYWWWRARQQGWEQATVYNPEGVNGYHTLSGIGIVGGVVLVYFAYRMWLL